MGIVHLRPLQLGSAPTFRSPLTVVTVMGPIGHWLPPSSLGTLTGPEGKATRHEVLGQGVSGLALGTLSRRVLPAGRAVASLAFLCPFVGDCHYAALPWLLLLPPWSYATSMVLCSPIGRALGHSSDHLPLPSLFVGLGMSVPQSSLAFQLSWPCLAPPSRLSSVFLALGVLLLFLLSLWL